MSAELRELFRNVFGEPRLEGAVPMDTFFMSLAPVVNGWRRGQNPLTGRVYWYNREGRVRRNPPQWNGLTCRACYGPACMSTASGRAYCFEHSLGRADGVRQHMGVD